MGRSHERTEIQGGPAVPQITDAHREEAVGELLSILAIYLHPVSAPIYNQLYDAVREDGAVNVEGLHPVLRRTVDMVAGYIASMPAESDRDKSYRSSSFGDL